MLDEMLHKCGRKIRWKFISFACVIKHVSSNMQVHSFIWCQIKDGKGHAFASDTIRACRGKMPCKDKMWKWIK